jgi:predicted HAD superfamily Cof-like phosphohydrolase
MKQLELFDDPREISVSQMVGEFAETAGQAKDIPLSSKLIKEEFIEWISSNDISVHEETMLELALEDLSLGESHNPTHELKELADLVYVIYGYALVKGYDLDGAIKAVHDNNMGRMVQADGTIQRRADGKILKNPDYPRVDLSEFTGEN